MVLAPLDLDAVKAFVRVAELGSFTRAADALGTTQGGISLRLKRLESRLACRLLERTPRHVRLTERGAAFLLPSRELLEAHERALLAIDGTRERLTIGISDHVAGPELATLIARLSEQNPKLLFEIRIGSSSDLLRMFDRREIDAAIVRFQLGREDGEVLAQERLRWFAAPGWRHRAGDSLPLATMPDPCGVRLMAEGLLDEAGVPWREVFVGGGVAAVSAAVMAGVGVAALAPRMLALGAVDVGPTLGLPDLPSLPIVLHSRAGDGRARAAIDLLSAAYRTALGSASPVGRQ